MGPGKRSAFSIFRTAGFTPGLITGLAVVVLVVAPAPAAGQEVSPKLGELLPVVQERVDADVGKLEAVYRELHARPELSNQEVRTAAYLAERMRPLGFEVTEQVGGHGIVCVLRNGEGPVVMVRADMDALPVTEKTGLEYASQVQVRDAEGKIVGVMHACGHDIHMTCWLGVARVLSGLKDRWKGTLVFVGQPAEERGTGARAMLDAGLLTRFPRPEFALALHSDAAAPAGTVRYTEGLALANVDSVDVTIKGQGGHGSMPHLAIDPVVLAARVVVDLQTLVSREIDPLDSAVVTVGSIHGGTKHNIIPSEVKLQITVRTFQDATRTHVLDGIARIAKAAAVSARAPEPEVTVKPDEYTPATFNHPQLTQRTMKAVGLAIGADNVQPKPPVMGGEDFSRFGRAGIPSCIFWLGTVAPDKVEKAKAGGPPLPSLHSELYAPLPGPSIRTGVLGMSAAVLNLVTK